MSDPGRGALLGLGLALGLGVLEGCAPLPVLTAEEAAAGRAARTAWDARGLPPPEGRQGRCQVERFYVLRPASELEFERRCHADPRAAAGCLNWTASGHFFRPSEWPVLVISPAHYSEPEIVVHELMHAMVRCAGLGASGWDPGDRQHLDPRVWSAAGGDTAAQSLARALLAGDGGR